MTEGDALRLAVALVAGVVASVVDVRERRIPNLVTFPAAATIIVLAAAEGIWRIAARGAVAGESSRYMTAAADEDAFDAGAFSPDAFSAGSVLSDLTPLGLSLLGAVAAGGVLFVLAWFGTLGLGDVKLAAALGAAMLPAFGWASLGLGFVLSYMFALPHALAVLVAGRRGRRRGGRPGADARVERSADDDGPDRPGSLDSSVNPNSTDNTAGTATAGTPATSDNPDPLVDAERARATRPRAELPFGPYLVGGAALACVVVAFGAG
ncbi:MAG: hypothetical protein ACTH31_13450 [Pseudoclavibacter sp.]